MKNYLSQFPHIFRKITARFVFFTLRTQREVQKIVLVPLGGARTINLPLVKQKATEFLANFNYASLRTSQKTTLFSVLGLLYLIFLVFPFSLSTFDKIKLQIINSPRNPEIHNSLADSFLSVYNYGAALNELKLAFSLKPNQQFADKLVRVTTLKAKPVTLQQELSLWQKIAKDKPDFRDAYFQQATLLYQLKMVNQTKEVLQKVFGLDPNFEEGRKLEKFILVSS